MKKLYKKIIGLEANDAKEILDKKGIDYETTSKLTFKEKTGYIVDIKENESGSLVLYESNRKMLIFIIILASLVVGLTATFGNGIYESIKEQIIEIGGIGKPELSVEEGWGQERTVNVIKDAKSNKKIIYYEYCVREKEEDKCNWNKTYTKNVVLGETGHWYVTFRAVNEEGKKGREATIEAYVDNIVPEISSFRVIEKTTNSIKVKTDTKDLHSGIAKIMYSIDGRTYVEASEEYIYTNLQPGVTYRLYVKVYDKAENGTIVSILVKTELTEEQKQALTEEELKKLEEETEEEKEDKWDIPKINLDKLPSVFTEKEEYDLPSFYDFGNDEGEVVCLVDGEETKDTSFIAVGRHTVKCTATSIHEKTAEVEKEILVQAEVGEDEIEDGWLKLNLYYPEESYNWQWRYGLTDNDIDEEFEETGWVDYTGPILIRIEDIPRIYIRYDQDGETKILPPTGVAFVEITFAKEKVACGDSTEVTIEYDANAILKQYRLNGGPWQDYEGPLEVNGNTRVEARVTKNEDVYNTDGDVEYTKLITGRDIKTVKETGCSIASGPRDAKLNLNGIPTTVYLGEDRSLPSYYTFGTHGEGTVECLDQNGNSLVTTKYLSVGTYTVTCSLEAGDGTTVGPISKTFTVKERVYAPEVSLWRIPSKIVKGDSYNLPSDYTYGSHGAGTVTCNDGLGNTITNTSTLEIVTW